MKPILFNTEMVRAILDGRKTVTRRIVKLPKHIKKQEDEYYTLFADGHCYEDYCFAQVKDYINPPHKIGDMLYVRETWQNVFETEYDKNSPTYCVDIRTLISNFDDLPKTNMGLSTQDSCSLMKPRNKYCLYKASDINYTDEENKLRWKPSIHMPKEAARIFLKVTSVRIEKLQDISEDSAVTEGFSPVSWLSARDLFANTWQYIYLNWDDNPWVWVIEFERCEREGD